MKPHRILIIAGAAGVRVTLAEIVASDPTLEILGAVVDPFMAAKRIANEIPDAIILDMQTPRMGGLVFLKKLMRQCPLPVVVFSTPSAEESPSMPTLQEAMEAGALDVFLVPETEAKEFLRTSAADILGKVKGVIKHRNLTSVPLSLSVQPKLTADVILPPRPPWSTVRTTKKIVCIGASTGGTDSLQVVLKKMATDCPGIVIVQHMPENFTNTFAQRLDTLCDISVREAQQGDLVLPGHALVAPGDQHLLLVRRGDHYAVELKKGPLVSRHRPSVDVLFRSAARSAGKNAIGVLLTGMGDDGAQGLLEMRQAGAHTIAEHESTCVVFGMPKEAINRGGAVFVVPLQKIAAQIVSLVAGD